MQVSPLATYNKDLDRKITNMEENLEYLLPVKFCQGVENLKMPKPIRGHGINLCFSIGLKNTNLVKDVLKHSFFLSNFCQILFSSSKGEVKHSGSIPRNACVAYEI